MFLDAEGETVMKHAGRRDLDSLGESLASLLRLDELKALVEGGDEKAKVEYLTLRLRLARIDYEEATRAFEELPKISSKQRKEIEALLVDCEVRTLMADAGDDRDKRLAAGARFAELFADKKQPSGTRELMDYWGALADHAEEVRDKRLFKKVVQGHKSTLKGSYFRDALKELEERLKNFPKK